MALQNEMIEYSQNGNNINKLREFTSVNTTNEILNNKKLDNANSAELKDLIMRIKKSRVKAAVSGHVDFKMDFDMTVFEWNQDSLKISGEYCMNSKLEEFPKEREFLNSVENNDDFCLGIILKDDVNSIWIVIKDSSFQFNKKYLKCAREFKEYNKCEFDLLIFDEEEIEEVKEQISFIKNYEVVLKNA